MPGKEKAVLQAHDVVKGFGAFEILRGASLQVYRGEKVGLIGRNGSGKSTLLRVLSGEERAVAGALWADFAGEPPPPWERDRVLAGLGLAHLPLDQPAQRLSGGEKTRLM